MFEHVNHQDLEKVTMSVITPQVVEEGRPWTITPDVRRRIRHAMFGARGTGGGLADAPVAEQRELLSQFTKMVVEPIVASLPATVSPWAVLILYQEFVDAVFIQPLWDGDVGGAG